MAYLSSNPIGVDLALQIVVWSASLLVAATIVYFLGRFLVVAPPAPLEPAYTLMRAGYARTRGRRTQPRVGRHTPAYTRMYGTPTIVMRRPARPDDTEELVGRFRAELDALDASA